MNIKQLRIHIGLRTIKTAVAVVVSLILVDAYGTTSSKLIFAMLGAMAAMEPTFKESFEACITQIFGVLFGAVAGILLISLPIHYLAATGIGIVLVITLYNVLRIRFSPGLSCLIVVTICTTPGIQPMAYAVARIWDTAIGLAIGMIINTLVFPYNNLQKIRFTAESLEREVITFLEDVFDGDDILPDTKKMVKKIDDMKYQLSIFSNQWMLLWFKRNRKKLEDFQNCEGKARQMVAQMEVLVHMREIGRLSDENRKLLRKSGADIRDKRKLDVLEDKDIITNYHVEQILIIRKELLELLKK